MTKISKWQKSQPHSWRTARNASLPVGRDSHAHQGRVKAHGTAGIPTRSSGRFRCPAPRHGPGNIQAVCLRLPAPRVKRPASDSEPGLLDASHRWRSRATTCALHLIVARRGHTVRSVATSRNPKLWRRLRNRVALYLGRTLANDRLPPVRFRTLSLGACHAPRALVIKPRIKPGRSIVKRGLERVPPLKPKD